MPSWKKLISSGSNAHLNAVTASSDIVISQDSKKLMLGAGNDLQIYHDGSNNYIDSTTSDQDLYIRGNDGGSMITAARFDMSDAGTLLPGNNLRMGDSKKIRLGSANDFNLYHDGSDSYIYNESSAGKIIIQNTTSDGDIEIKVNDGGSTTNAIVIDASDNSRVKLPNDNQRLSIGASNDIQITHDGTNSYFDNYTGDLIIKNNADDAGIRLQSDDGSGGTTNYITLDGQFTSINLLQSTALAATKKLFFDGGNGTYIQESSDDILKFYVGGVNLLTMVEGGTNVVKVGDGTYLGVGDSTDLYMYHTAGASFINNGTGMFTIRNQAQDQDIRFSVNDGGVTSNILTLNAASSRVGIGTTAPATNLEVKTTGDTTTRISTGGASGDVATLQLYRNSAAYAQMHYEAGGGNDAGLHLTDFRDDANSHIIFNTRGDNERMRIEGDGNVGIGTSSPSSKFHVSGGDSRHSGGKLIYEAGGISDYFKIQRSSSSGRSQIQLANESGTELWRFGTTGGGSEDFEFWDGSFTHLKFDRSANSAEFGGSVGINVTPSGTSGRLDCSNDVVAFSTSDKRLKENIKPLDSALDKVLKISGVEFDWKELTEEEKKTIHGNEGHDVGVIAQEIEEVLPEVVTTRESGYKAVKYEKIVPLLIEAIKEQQQQINQLEEKLNG